jgi:GGDEF domain-containing protein
MHETSHLPDRLKTKAALKFLGAAACAGVGVVLVGQQVRLRRAVEQQRLLQVQNDALIAKNEALQYEATRDGLTGLLNKAAFKNEIEELVKKRESFGVSFIDMDGAKLINDDPRFGHEFLDSLLARLGARLGERFHRKDEIMTHETKINGDIDQPTEEGTLGRYGGDEFGNVVRLNGDNGRREPDPKIQMENSNGYLREVLDEFAAEECAAHEGLQFGFSIGYAIWDPKNPQSPKELLKAADDAMYADKRQRKSQLESAT